MFHMGGGGGGGGGVLLEEDLLGCDGIGGLAYLLFCAAYWSRQPRGISAFKLLLFKFQGYWALFLTFVAFSV